MAVRWLLASLPVVVAQTMCTTKMLSPGATGASEYVSLPHFTTSMRSFSMWVYINPRDQQDDSYVWKYLIDFRPGLFNGYVSFENMPNLVRGNRINKIVVHNHDTSPPTRHVWPLPTSVRDGGVWQHWYIQSSQSWTPNIN